ncbi:hypothetical protein [Pseudonocardia sp. KRD291]|uniref:hypothetical protein n=1 Tax=Pseudonocardia sp. KRD291 TaxID=2792007 RepID=UPI001C4A2D50|nr:hypothetical protein [Pseudonocardia sp. KRD291]MBW0101572.1 hypothetical protein [Pseudonocardia sp. KRD291]
MPLERDAARLPGTPDGEPSAPPARGTPPPGPADTASRRPRRRWPRITAVAVVSGIVVAALVLGVTALLTPSFSGRAGLLALPTESSGSTLLNRSGVSTGYGEVVGLAMPSISDLVTSPTLLDAVAAQVPGSPPPDELGSRIGVELLAGSGVARISATADSPELAGRLAEAVAQQVIRADLLAPAGTLRTLDARASVTQVSPDWTLATGLALIAGLVAALAAALAMRPFRARVPAGRAALEAVTSTGRGPVAVFDVDDPALLDRVGVLVRAADRPLRVIAAGPGVDGAVRGLCSDLAESGAAPRAGNGSRDGDGAVAPSVLVVVDRAAVRGDDVRGAIDALPPSEPVLAVVLV